jgi:hypothetical protein
MAEWWSDRGQPWVHYVPVKVDYTDLVDVMAYVSADQLGLRRRNGDGGKKVQKHSTVSAAASGENTADLIVQGRSYAGQSKRKRHRRSHDRRGRSELGGDPLEGGRYDGVYV